MMLANQVYASSDVAAIDVAPPTTLITHGEYTIHPMQFAPEKDVARLFTKVCQRGNPVLQGRPFADLERLGMAMYRKSTKLGMGQVAMHDGKLVALGCCWDAAEGGVWTDTGLEMPPSLAAHAACGKACFDAWDAVPEAGNSKTLFCAFYGVLPPHSAHCFGIMATSHFKMSEQMGFEYSFQFTLLPTLKGRGVFSDSKSNTDSRNWAMKFSDVASERKDVLEELSDLGGSINLQLTRIAYNLSDEYMTLAAATVRMKTADELRRPQEITAANHMKWLQSFDFAWSTYMAQGNGQITSRL
jgi:hypothetical protein